MNKENNMCMNANEGYAAYAANEIHALTEENKMLKEQVECLEQRIRDLMHEREKAYRDGTIEGLKFAIRCNGVSGNEVQ